MVVFYFVCSFFFLLSVNTMTFLSYFSFHYLNMFYLTLYNGLLSLTGTIDEKFRILTGVFVCIFLLYVVVVELQAESNYRPQI